MRWGTTVFFFVVSLLLAASWVIEYPDLVKASFVLTSVNAPKPVTARTEGKLVRMLVHETEPVDKNQALAYLESTADHETVLRLEQRLNALTKRFSQGEPLSVQEIRFLETGGLGELQTAFQTFMQARQQYTAFLNGGFYEQKRSLLVKELDDLRLLAQNLQKQKWLHEQDYALAQNEFRIHEKLVAEKVIAPLEFKREESKLLAKQMPLQQSEATLLNNQAAQTGKRKEILELDKLISEQENTFGQSLNTMRSQVEDWKKKHLLVAPMAGRVHFSSFLQENQTVKAGQEVFFIGTENNREFGEVRVPQYNFGKVKAGQKVWVKFNGYPSQEFGMVEGKVEFISQIPGRDSAFLAKVVLPKGPKTNYGRTLTYTTGMTATANMVTENRRVLEKVLFNFRKAVQR